jgi:bifunctional enzyme CysN/CysC
MPVQWVNRPHSDFRGFAGTVAAGSIAPGDPVQVLPSGQQALVEEVILFRSIAAQGIAKAKCDADAGS